MPELFARWEKLIDRGIEYYVNGLDVVLRHKTVTIAGSFTLLAVTLAVLLPVMRRDFFPEVDSGAFEIAARAPGRHAHRSDRKADREVEKFIKEDDRQRGPGTDRVRTGADGGLVRGVHGQRRAPWTPS